ncbi:MAG: lysophospholipid acyltransferase family protein [Geminicoccaceae bacterium]
MADVSARRSHVRAAARLILLVLLTVTLLMAAIMLSPFGRRARGSLIRLWCGGCCAIAGLRVRTLGRPYVDRPTLFVANHLSYIDIPVIGSRVDGAFVAKKEVAGWPVVGFLARYCGTIFIHRHWRDALIQRNILARRLRAESVLLFPEGTSSDGRTVLPFKSSLFSVAEPWIMDRPIAVQPISLRHAAFLDGTPMTPENAGLYAWVDDARLLPHMWQMLALPGLHIIMSFGEPVMSWKVKGRKPLARFMRNEVAMMAGNTAPSIATIAETVIRPLVESRFRKKIKEARMPPI